VGALARLGPALESVARGPAGPTAARRPRRKPSPQRLAALKLQGRYMGYVRNLGPRQKARVKALREAKGVNEAISFAKKLAR
jgi:hypothetical protein